MTPPAPPVRGDVLQWGVNGRLEDGPEGWRFVPPIGEPGPAYGDTPSGMMAALGDWYRWLRANPNYVPVPGAGSEWL